MYIYFLLLHLHIIWKKLKSPKFHLPILASSYLLRVMIITIAIVIEIVNIHAYVRIFCYMCVLTLIWIDIHKVYNMSIV